MKPAYAQRKWLIDNDQLFAALTKLPGPVTFDVAKATAGRAVR